jgi:hypothetical protein
LKSGLRGKPSAWQASTKARQPGVGSGTSATRIGPIRTSAMMNLEPVIAIALSTVVLHQGLSGLQYAGGVLVMVGVVGAQLSRMPTPAASRSPEKT